MGYASRWITSPIGPLELVAEPEALVAVLWRDDRRTFPNLVDRAEDPDHGILTRAAAQLEEYFAGQRRSFSISMRIQGSQWSHTVWADMLTIPYGEVRSYKQLAQSTGYPTASRAVGAAVGRNPLAIFYPCHRVVGSTGSMTGFAGGLLAKMALLDLEQKHHQEPSLR